MMNPASIVSKTRKGDEEIRNRTHGLGRNLRTLLILIDGKSTVEEILAEKAIGLDGADAGLDELAEGGFIAFDGEAVAETAGGGGDIAEVKAELIAIANELLGPDGEKIISKLEAAPESKEGLLEAVSGCKKLVKLIIDENKAEQLMQRCSVVIQRL